MRSFQSVVFCLFALLACAFAQSSEAEAYDATVYITSTVVRVSTIYQSGSPTSAVYNSTSTIAALRPSGYMNATTLPSTTAKTSTPAFTGAASALNAHAFVAAFAAGVGYLVL